MMRSILQAAVLIALTTHSTDAWARGGFSTTSSRGGFSSSRSFSTPSVTRSYSAPKPSVSPSVSHSTVSAPSVSRSTTSAPRSTSTTTVTTSRTSSSPNYASYHPSMYPGFGMGYGYYGSNGLLTGLIIGNMMHPSGTTVYTGGGVSGSALLYPDGRVVDQNGFQVGTFSNGQFSALQGGMVAQSVPSDFQPQPVVIDSTPSAWEIVGYVILAGFALFLLISLFA